MLYTEREKQIPSDKHISISVIESETELNNIHQKWNNLAILAKSPVYLTHEWISTWWKHFGRHPKRSLFIILIAIDGQLKGIAPFFVGISSVGPMIFQKRLFLAGCGTGKIEGLGFTNDYGYSDFLDVIVHPDYEKDVADALVAFCMRNSMDIDKIIFPHVNDDSFVVRQLQPRLLASDKPNIQIAQADECPYLELPDSMETYLEEIVSSSRRRRFRKNLRPAGKKYEVEHITTSVRAEEMLEKLYRYHQYQWNAQGYPGAFFDQRQYNFIKEINKIALEKGWLWFKIAKDREGISALRWVLKYNNRYFDCYTSYDIEAPSSKHSPGLGLLALLIKDAIEDGAERLELLRGAERYKFDFTKQSGKNWRIVVNLYNKKSKLRSIMNKMTDWLARTYAILANERTLLLVHKEKVGFLKMTFSYAFFRFERLKAKLKS